MHLYGTSVFEQQNEIARDMRGQAGKRLRAIAAVVLTMAAGMPSGFAQQATVTVEDKAESNLPSAPAPVLTQPFSLRPSDRDFTKPAGPLKGNPINAYRPTTIAKARFVNSVRLADMVKDGKIHLSLSDAIALALENNYDIAIARYNLDIADTDMLRANAGSTLRGVSTGVLTNTLGGSSSTLTTGGGPGGTTGGSGGAASGSSGLVLSTSGAGPTPEALDPTLTGTVQLERARAAKTSPFSGGSTNTDEYNFKYAQGFVTGTDLTVAFDNSRTTTVNAYTTYSPLLNATFKATVTQHLLQGAGIWVNKRFVYEAINNRKITDSSFRQQLLYTVNQVETIYWGLVNAYETVQAKERALEQSTKLADDNRKQLEIGTLAPLDVVNSDSAVATDKQALISAQSTLNYQQQIIKQAVARNLNDPALVAAAVIPTDRVSLETLPEESQSIDDLVQQAFQQRPELEQAVLTLKNNAITLRGAKNALLPTLDVYGFYGATGLGGDLNPNASCNFTTGGGCNAADYPSYGYGTAFSRLFESKAPDKGVGFNLSIPIRNRTAQADQARSLIEYRQSELRLEQLYTQIRMQVVNAQFALTNDRAQVKASIAAQDYAQQSLDAEVKKLRLGASTSANVLMQQRNLATAENNLIAANAAFAEDRAGLYQMLASTLQHYGINLTDAASGDVKTAPVVPGIQPARDGKEVTTAPPASR
jgi:outer membrane protein TolC